MSWLLQFEAYPSEGRGVVWYVKTRWRGSWAYCGSVFPLQSGLARFLYRRYHPEELLALDEMLDRLGQAHPDVAQLVKFRYFVGMTQDEAARILGISRRKVNNRWAFARAWLHRTMRPDEAEPSLSQKTLHK